MDHRRHSGSHPAQSSQYYDDHHWSTSQAPLTDRRRPFSARAGQGVGDVYDTPVQNIDSGRPEDRGLPSRTRGLREPLAALHVPKTHGSPAIVPRVYNSNRPGVASSSPLSPQDPSSARNQARGSVSDRSPLQRLEGKLDDISKEEKRARVEEAEHHARERERHRAVANQSRRVDSQPTVYHSHHTQQPPRRESATIEGDAVAGRRHSSAPQSTSVPGGRHDRGSVDLGHRPFEASESRANAAPNSQAIDAGNRFRRASDALRMQNRGISSEDRYNQGISNDDKYYQSGQPSISGEQDRNAHRRNDLDRSESKKYRHRLRDAGYVGAASAATASDSTRGATFGPHGPNEEDGRRMSHDQGAQTSAADLNRNNSRKLQKKVLSDQQQLHIDRAGSKRSQKMAGQDLDSHHAVHSPQSQGHAYQVPLQTEGERGGGHVGFDGASPYSSSQMPTATHQHRFGNVFHGHHERTRVYQQGPIIEEWRDAGIARLRLEDLAVNALDAGSDTSGAWWERKRSKSNSIDPSGYDGPYDEEARSFRPSLLLKCGPLLRYTGMRHEKISNSGNSEREIWRGSVMIVTLDSHSSYGSAPILRLFAQPMDLLPSSSSNPGEESHKQPFEQIDPIAGHTKVSRTGRPLYVKPVDELEECVDLSRVEDESGLFETTKSPNLGAQQVKGADGQPHQHITMQNRSRIQRRDGEKSGKYREVTGARLHADRGVTFWRFNIEIELGSAQARVAYRINRGPAIGFWVPARGESMNIMFHSCNGFSLSVDPNLFSGPDPLWRDVLNKHQSKPFHVMLGGGDQIYNDAATRDTNLFKEWLQIKNPEHKHNADFTEQMQDELEDFYLNRYSMWFSQGMFGLANCQIPMVNVWDDHDIIDGFGSYPHRFMSTKVFTGLGAVAFKYYMLFQHQSVVSESHREEPSWLLGASPGPYINELSRSIFMSLGRKVAFLGLDCRTERMRDEILSQESYDIIFDRCRHEIIKGQTKHLLVLLGVPIAYPRLNFLENILTSRVMDPIKAIGRTGVLGGFVNKFDGGVEILDDLDDHWTAKHHKAERNWFIQELQELAAEKSVRVTILGGDVHLGAVGQFYTKKKLAVPKDRDHRYMPNVISSAIVNTPPPNLMGDVLNKRNKIHHLDNETDEDMIPMFDEDVDGKSRNNLHLLPRRNYCTIREYIPGSTPPSSPRPEVPTPGSAWSQSQENGSRGRQYPPGSMRRTLSLTGGSFRPGNLVRRLSGSRTRTQPPLTSDHTQRHEDYGHSRGQGEVEDENHDSYFPLSNAPPVNGRPSFHRRPTNLSEKAALKASARGGAEGNVDGREMGHIDLEGGLDIALNMEISQQDPAGSTVPYRLLVPALWYEGSGDQNTARFKSRKSTLMDRLRGRGAARAAEGDYSGSETDSRASSTERPGGWPNSSTRREGFGTNENTTRQGGGNGFDGTHDVYNKELGAQPPGRHPAVSDNKDHGAPVSAPPAPHPSQIRRSVDEPKRGGMFSGFRRSAPRNEAYYDSEDDGSFTESDLDSVELDQQQQQRQRRPSKTDRFFGIGEQRGEARGNTQDRYDSHAVAEQDLGPNGLPYEGKKRGWKLWK